MKFGKVDEPGSINFTLPDDHPDTLKSLSTSDKNKALQLFIGCAKWNRQDLKNFYPRGVKDELTYYSSQFNSIELNATFYNLPAKEQVVKWRDKTPADFKFFPKITNTISHFRRLINTEMLVEEFADAVSHFEQKLGMAFLQLNNNYKPKDFDRLEKFILNFPKEIPLAVEVRNEEWFSNQQVADNLIHLLSHENRINMLVDTAGRRDMLHMRLTNDCAFVRFVGANHMSDYARLDDWVKRVILWKKQGLKQLYFFIHQNVELESPLLSAYFIQKLNDQMGVNLTVPAALN